MHYIHYVDLPDYQNKSADDALYYVINYMFTNGMHTGETVQESMFKPAAAWMFGDFSLTFLG